MKMSEISSRISTNHRHAHHTCNNHRTKCLSNLITSILQNLYKKLFTIIMSSRILEMQNNFPRHLLLIFPSIQSQVFNFIDNIYTHTHINIYNFFHQRKSTPKWIFNFIKKKKKLSYKLFFKK